MSTSPHVVALVVDPAFGERVVPLSERVHVWLVDSEPNRAAAERLWARGIAPAGHPLESGITLFQGEGRTPSDVAIAILDMLTEHHNEWSHDPPMTVLEIHGAAITPALREALEDFGFPAIRKHADHVVAEAGEPSERT